MPEDQTAPTTQENQTVPAASDPKPAGAPAAAPLPPVGPVVPDTGYTAGGVPTFDGVREKIESRYGTAIGATELAEETPEGRTAEQKFDARQKAAEEKLAEIRASMHKPE